MEDLRLISWLRQLIPLEPVMAQAGLDVMAGHLDYLSDELSPFALIDIDVDEEQAEEMARELWAMREEFDSCSTAPYQVKVPGPNFVRSADFWSEDGSTPRLRRFTSVRSFLIFKLLGQTVEDLEWMSRPWAEWRGLCWLLLRRLSAVCSA